MNAATSDPTGGASDPTRSGADRRGEDRRIGARRSTQAVLRQIVELLPDGIVVVGADGLVRFANPAAARLFGRAARELVGQDFGYPLTTDEAAEIEVVRRGEGGGVGVAELRVVQSEWENEPATLVALRDVTDRKRGEDRERQLERERSARAEAEAANQAKSEFLAVMSHELRTPLNAVLGYAQLLDLEVVGPLSLEQRRQVGRITSSGRHLLGLVNQILDLAKVEAGRLTVTRQPAAVTEVLDAALVLAQPQAEARGLAVHMPTDLDPTLQFLGDRDRVLQILANLLSNAVKFTAAGGEVRVVVDVVRGATASSRLGADGTWIAIRVRDTGVGIPAEQIDTVFAPFVQGEGGHTRSQDGSGLGLTISRRLALLMHGDVTVASEVGQGSEFVLWLPIAEPRARDASFTPPIGEPAVVITRGLADYGAALQKESEAILDAYVARLRRDPELPMANARRSSELRDHAGAMLADLSATLVTLDESEGSPSDLLTDAADIQHFLADRHGLQRARLGWTAKGLARETVILDEEIAAAMERRFAERTHETGAEEASGVISRYLAQVAETARRALERARRAGDAER